MINSGYLAIKDVNWDQKGKQYLTTQNYIEATKLYEQAINVEPNVKSHYWNLGLVLLLQGKETEAQTCWFLAMAEEDEDEVELWTQELIETLKREAERRYSIEDYSVAWVIRQHIREISPTDISNLLYLIELNICLKTYTGNEIIEWGLIDILQETKPRVDLDYELLDKVQQKILEYAPLHPSSLEFTEARIPYIEKPSAFVDNFMLPIIYKTAYEHRKQQLSLQYVDLGLRIFPNHPELLRCLATFYTDLGEYSKALETGKLCYALQEKETNG